MRLLLNQDADGSDSLEVSSRSFASPLRAATIMAELQAHRYRRQVGKEAYNIHILNAPRTPSGILADSKPR